MTNSEPTIIHPTVGRVVHYYPHESEGHAGSVLAPGEPRAAIVAHVWTERMVNLTVFDANGETEGRTSVPLVQPGEPAPGDGGYCQWMPYQVGQAARTEELEQALDGR